MIYDFCCEDCGEIFDIVSTISEISSLKPICTKCESSNTHRNWSSVTMFGPDKTLGSLADKNSKEMSQDCKDALYYKQTQYRRKPFTGKLPDGAKTTRET